jgi:Ca2+-binding RTX toxin-like protein
VVSRVGSAALTVAAVTAAFATVATPAQAATTGVAKVVTSTKVQYDAGHGKTNSVTVTRSGHIVTIDDKVTVKAGKGCKAVKGDKTKVRCTTSKTPTRVGVYLRDRNDSVINNSDLAISARGGDGNDTLKAGPRGDDLSGDDGNDTLYGLAGNDWIEGGPGNDRLYGGEGSDTLSGMSGNDREYGGGGPDTLNQSGDPDFPDADLLSGGGGNDDVWYGTRDKSITADADGAKRDDGAKGEHDTIATDVETLYGGYGNDRLYGTAGPDGLIGGYGNDILLGRAGDDTLNGKLGNDTLDGGGGDDFLFGDDDDGVDEGAPGADTIKGGSGIDWVSYYYATKAITADLDGKSRDDGVKGEHDTLGADIENISGGSGGDKLTGNASRNILDGADGADTLRGGAGDDELTGGYGADSLFGEAGDDHLDSGDELGSGTPWADKIDGGADGTARGDYCIAWERDTSARCERFWPEADS